MLRLPELGRTPGSGFPIPISALVGGTLFLVLTLLAVGRVLLPSRASAIEPVEGRLERYDVVYFSLPRGEARGVAIGDTVVVSPPGPPAADGRIGTIVGSSPDPRDPEQTRFDVAVHASGSASFGEAVTVRFAAAAAQPAWARWWVELRDWWSR